MQEANHETTTPTRGGLLSAAVGPLAALLPTAAAPDADAELIRLCAQHIANVRAYNRQSDFAETSCDNDPLWHACQQTEAAIDALPPQTIAGIVAKAQVARAEAREASAEGGELWEGSSAVPWARDVVNDLLRLYGRA